MYLSKIKGIEIREDLFTITINELDSKKIPESLCSIKLVRLL